MFNVMRKRAAGLREAKAAGPRRGAPDKMGLSMTSTVRRVPLQDAIREDANDTLKENPTVGQSYDSNKTVRGDRYDRTREAAMKGPASETGPFTPDLNVNAGEGMDWSAPKKAAGAPGGMSHADAAAHHQKIADHFRAVADEAAPAEVPDLEHDEY